VGFPVAAARADRDHLSVVELDALTIRWQWALDAGGRALDAASDELSRTALARHRDALAHERTDAAGLLARVAATEQSRNRPWLAPVPVTPRHLGLPNGTEACLFDLDGVLTDSNALHAQAWAHVLDDVLLRTAQEAERHFVPFDPVEDYQAHFDGRSRLEGIRSFLESRGIRLPAGGVTEASVAEHKGETVERLLHGRGVSGLPGARPYLLAAAFAHLRRGVVSASSSTIPMLELAQLAQLVETRVEPDVLLTACDHLNARPERTVMFTHGVAGIAAARVAGIRAIGVASGDLANLLEDLGADPVVPKLDVLLESQLRSGLNGHAHRLPVLVSR
jgi:beta-phosphoglucomutase-like phosphatase (HAD superfamily)